MFSETVRALLNGDLEMVRKLLQESPGADGG
jgi:hypothetical protein